MPALQVTVLSVCNSLISSNRNMARCNGSMALTCGQHVTCNSLALECCSASAPQCTAARLRSSRSWCIKTPSRFGASSAITRSSLLRGCLCSRFCLRCFLLIEGDRCARRFFTSPAEKKATLHSWPACNPIPHLLNTLSVLLLYPHSRPRPFRAPASSL